MYSSARNTSSALGNNSTRTLFVRARWKLFTLQWTRVSLVTESKFRMESRIVDVSYVVASETFNSVLTMMVRGALSETERTVVDDGNNSDEDEYKTELKRSRTSSCVCVYVYLCSQLLCARCKRSAVTLFSNAVFLSGGEETTRAADWERKSGRENECLSRTKREFHSLCVCISPSFGSCVCSPCGNDDSHVCRVMPTDGSPEYVCRTENDFQLLWNMNTLFVCVCVISMRFYCENKMINRNEFASEHESKLKRINVDRRPASMMNYLLQMYSIFRSISLQSINAPVDAVFRTISSESIKVSGHSNRLKAVFAPDDFRAAIILSNSSLSMRQHGGSNTSSPRSVKVNDCSVLAAPMIATDSL